MDNKLWLALHNGRITSSRFGEILHRGHWEIVKLAIEIVEIEIEIKNKNRIKKIEIVLNKNRNSIRKMLIKTGHPFINLLTCRKREEKFKFFRKETHPCCK